MGLHIDEVRRQRDLMLAATDKYESIAATSGSDEERQAWLDYRQALRDITNLTEFSSENDFWPLPPKRYRLLDGDSTINLPVSYVDQY